MLRKKKKNGVKTSWRNSSPVGEDDDGLPVTIRLQKGDELDENALEATLLIVETMAGAFPLIKKQEAYQTTYDAIMDGIQISELNKLGKVLLALGESDSGTLQ